MLLLDAMHDKLREDPDFKRCPTILEDNLKAYNERPVASRVCRFEMTYLPKFWCSLAWIEQYWNDCKRMTREQCDYTMPTLKATFPVALETACPVTQIRKYMQRSLDHMTACTEIGRHGDFGSIPSLRRKYKSHRRAELVRFGLASEEPKRDRRNWGPLLRARRIARTQEQIDASEAAIEAAAVAEASAAAEAATAAALRAVDEEKERRLREKERAQAALASAREHVRRAAEGAAAENGTAERENADEDEDEPDLPPEPVATRLTGKRHCARAPGAPIARAFA
jgi:hypothetical protein